MTEMTMKKVRTFPDLLTTFCCQCKHILDCHYKHQTGQPIECSVNVEKPDGFEEK